MKKTEKAIDMKDTWTAWFDELEQLQIPFNTWKEMMMRLRNIDQVSADKLFKDRDEYVKCLLNEQCRFDCQATGSKEKTSDIDVTIKNVHKSRIILQNLDSTLYDTFKDARHHLEMSRNQVIRSAKRFLDLNFYVSDYDLSKPVVILKDCVEHVTSDIGITYYISSKQNTLQRYFAYNRWPEAQKAFVSGLQEQFQLFVPRNQSSYAPSAHIAHDYSNHIKMYQNLMEELGQYSCYKHPEARERQDIIDDAVNVIALMTLHEDEAFITQGSFYIWVLHLKHLPYWILLDCFIEQICMAWAHREDASSFAKYLSRAVNVHDILKPSESFLTSHGLDDVFWNKVKDFLLVKSTSEIKDTLNIANEIKNTLQPNLWTVLKNILENVVKHRDAQKDYENIYHEVNLDFLQMPSTQGGNNKNPKLVHILGRMRKVTKIGRKSVITYKKQQIGLSDARALEKQLKKKK
jgi:hypothetical protein